MGFAQAARCGAVFGRLGAKLSDMPRTPLFATLRRLARAAVQADEVRGSLPRSTFLGGAAALPVAAALAAVPCPAAAAANRRVAVIGAGIGGLTAALTLHDAG